MLFYIEGALHHRNLHSFPTRRSSDLSATARHGRSATPPVATVRRPSSPRRAPRARRSEEHTSELQSRENLVCRLLLEKKKKNGNSMSGRLKELRLALLLDDEI